ncbi:MAG: acylneuraminate cytidylyltransferase family protein [Candidatus Helarchaeota archaeon]
MINGKSILAIIPARGGSKGLPGKNIKLLNGKPLIVWTIEAGLKSKYIDELMVTTDSTEIAELVKKHGANVPFIRPAYLATDTAATIDVIDHTLRYYHKNGKNFDIVVLLQPTSPLREDDDIDNMLEKFSENITQCDSIISIGEVHEHPSIMKKIENGRLKPICNNLEIKTRRQDNEKAYFPYGVAYIAKKDKLIKFRTFYMEKSCFYIIKRYQCYEIDDIYDFIVVEAIMKYQKGDLK